MEKNSYKAKLATRLSTSEGEPGRNTAMKIDVRGQRQNCILELSFTCYTDIVTFRHRFFLQTLLNMPSFPLCSTSELAHLIHVGQLRHLCPANTR